MTTPDPRRAPDAHDAAYADLLAHLVRVIPVTAGLAQVIGGTPADLPPDTDAEPGQAAHTRLLTDLTIALHPDTGLAAILAIESGLIGVVDELSATLDTDRGLASILGTPSSAADAPVDTAAEPADPSAAVSAGETPSTPSTMDDLAALYLAPADQRLHLRAGLPSRAARDALRHLENIRIALSQIATGPHPLDSRLDTAPTVLDRQRARIARALTVMAQALASYRRQPGAPAPQDPSISDGGDLQIDLIGTSVIVTEVKNRPADDANIEEHEQPVVDNSERLTSENKELDELLYQLKIAHQIAGEPSYRTIASRSGRKLSASTIGRIFRGTQNPPQWPSLQALLTGLGVPRDELPTRWYPLWVAAAMVAQRQKRAGLTAETPAAEEAAQAELAVATGALYHQTFVEVEERVRDTTGYERWVRWLNNFRDVQAEGAAASVPSHVLRDAAARSASLLQQTADELAALYDHLVDRLPSTAGARLLHGCAHHVDELTATVRQLWAALSDFRGADLRAATDVAIEGLDEVRWSDGTADTEPTRWPTALAPEVLKHSKRVDDLPGVWEIGFGAAISPGCR